MTPTSVRTGRYLAEPDVWSTLIEQLAIVVRRAWCWRELTLPALAIAVVYKTGDRGLAFMAATLMLCVVVLLLLSRRDVVFGVVRRCSARDAALARQIAWPRICQQLGWTRRLQHGGSLIPSLVSWSEDEQRVRVVVRPLPEQGANRWHEMADAIRRTVSGASVQWRESHGRLEIVISRAGLPSRLSWTPGLSDLGRIVIGQRHGGVPLALDVLRTPHVLLAGATGSGKGGAIRTAVAGALEAGWQVVVIDPKESGEYRWLDCLGVPVISNVVAQVEALNAIEMVREFRQSVIRECGADVWHQLPPRERRCWRPLLVVIDEAADLLVPVKGRSEPQREHAALQQEAGRLIVQLARKGRSAGIHLILAIQRPDTAQLGDQGGALRNNLTARLALGSLDAEGIRMLGIPNSDPVVMALDGTPGRGICVGFGDDPRPGACQVAWLQQAQASQYVSVAFPQGLDTIGPYPVTTPVASTEEDKVA